MSQKITPQDAISWLAQFTSNNPGIKNANNDPIDGFSFNPQHMIEVASNLDPDTDEFFIGIAEQPDGSNALVVCGVKVEKDGQGNIIKRTILFNNDTQPIYDYGSPCPPANPTSYINI